MSVRDRGNEVGKHTDAEARAEAESSLRFYDHVTQRVVGRRKLKIKTIYRSINFRFPGAGQRYKKQDVSIFMNSHGLTLHSTMESLILAQDER